MDCKSRISLLVNSDKIKAAILVFVSLAIGIYLILTTVMISRDAVDYIKETQGLEFFNLSSVRWYGFSAVNYGMHKFLNIFCQDSNQLWIYSGQIVSLIFKTASIVILFLLGKRLFGSSISFLSCFILVLLPYPAHFGSDFLRDWSGIFFISLSALFLFEWIYKVNLLYLILSIIVSGIGYFFRPEAAQVSIYAVILVIGYIVKSKNALYNKKLTIAVLSILIFIGSVSSFLFSYKNGQYFPRKLKNVIAGNTISHTQPVVFEQSVKRFFKSFSEIIEGVSENLNYYFLPFMLLGIWAFWRISKTKSNYFYIKLFYCSFILLNIIMLILLNYKWDYVSRRHCLPLAVMLIYFIPYGILSVSRFLVKNISGFKRLSVDSTANILAAIGIVICLAKLFIPLGYDKTHYLQASRWLTDNTNPNAVIAVSDSRIGFYADRKFIAKQPAKIFSNDADYSILSTKNDPVIKENYIKAAEFSKAGRNKVIIYKKTELCF